MIALDIFITITITMFVVEEDIHTLTLYIPGIYSKDFGDAFLPLFNKKGQKSVCLKQMFKIVQECQLLNAYLCL